MKQKDKQAPIIVEIQNFSKKNHFIDTYLDLDIGDTYKSFAICPLKFKFFNHITGELEKIIKDKTLNSDKKLNKKIPNEKIDLKSPTKIEHVTFDPDDWLRTINSRTQINNNNNEELNTIGVNKEEKFIDVYL